MARRGRAADRGESPPNTDRAAAVSRLQVQRVRPAYQQVAAELRAQIVAGVLQAGERLPTEPELAQMFGVSRGTVREALRSLLSQHLIETTRGVAGGSFVASPNFSELIDDLGGALGLLVMTPQLSIANLLEARLLLEPSAARLAAVRIDRDTAEAVTVAAEAASDGRDPSGFASHIDFHSTVLMASRNPLLAMMLQPISDVLRTRLSRSTTRHSGSWEHIDECHFEIAEAIAAGDGDRAEVLMREHLHELRPLYEELDNARA